MREHAGQQSAFLWLAGGDGGAVGFAALQCSLALVEAQPAFARAFILAVAVKAVLGQQRLDVAGIINRGQGRACGKNEKGGQWSGHAGT